MAHRLHFLLALPLLSLITCRRTEEQRPIATRDTARAREEAIRDRLIPLGYPPTHIALADFRPQMPIGADTGGRCREDPYWTTRGFRAVSWRRDDASDRWWRIDVAIDSTGAVRRYLEDRYAGRAGRTMILVDLAEGWGTAENSPPGAPAQKTGGDAVSVFHAPSLDDPSTQAARVLERCRASLDPWGVLARLPDSLRPPLAPRPAPRVPAFDRTFLKGEPGEGYLAVRGSSFEGLNWLRLVILPLYTVPRGEVSAWLARGWVVRPLVPAPSWRELTVAGIYGVGDESIALTVLDLRDNGWFRLRYAAPDGVSDGTAWAHVSHLSFGDVDLRLVRWDAHFLRGGETVFRTSGIHYLRQTGSDESGVLDSLPSPDRWGGRSEVRHTLTPLEMHGDWMRVRVQWPGGWCARERTGPTREGWVRWRDSVNGVMLTTGVLTC